MKNKIIKMRHNSLYTLTIDWFGESISKINQVSLKQAKSNLLLIVVSKVLTNLAINKFRA